MYSIIKLDKEQLKDLAKICVNAYPGILVSLEEYEKKLYDQSLQQFVEFYGVYNECELRGGMRLHDFKMNLLQEEVIAGGIGSVAVDLLHKKEKVAFEMVKFFLEHYKEKGASIALLYPFNPEFYKNMGFGFGTSLNQFKIKPKDLPNAISKKHIKALTIEDSERMCNFYNKTMCKTNGLIKKYNDEFERVFKVSDNKIYAYEKNNEILGYVIFNFKRANVESILVNDIFISELLFENSEVFKEIMTFLNSQNDQIRYIIINTQDENLRFALKDPRNNSDRILYFVYHECSHQGTGIMYRVINIPKLFYDLKNHNFNNVTCTLKLNMTDTFIKENNDSYIIVFDNGKASIKDVGDYDVEVSMDISDFSSLITCVVDFKSLHRYGNIEVSNEKYLNTLNMIFSSDEKPICLSKF